MNNRIKTQMVMKTLKCFIFFITLSMQGFSQATNYKCKIKNVVLLNPSSISVDIWIENTGVYSLNISGFQAGINFNYSSLANGGTITASSAGGGNIFYNVNLNPVSKQIRISNLSGAAGVSIPSSPGIKLGTFILTNTVPFNSSVPPAFLWSFETSTISTTNTIVLCRVNGDPRSTNITVPGNHLVNDIDEICGNGVDDNFNGIIDEGCSPFVFLTGAGFPRCNTLQDYSIYLRNGILSNGIVMFEADIHMTYSMSTPAPDSISGNKYYFHFTGQQLYSNSKLATIKFYMPGPNSTICSHVIMNPIDNSGNINYNISYENRVCQTVRCSFDPNEKIVSPLENIPAPRNSWMTYTIFFQNTGNDTAYNINVKDTLDASLDRYTFMPLESSHPYTTSIDANSVVTFSFNNIYLPDSIVDEPGSHGHITYVIKPLPGILNNTLVKNAADIYFDFNPPIRTNTTLNILSDIPCPNEICGNGIDDNCNGQIDEGCISINIKAFIEGYYIGNGTMNAAIDPVLYPNLSDTIILQLAQSLSPYSIADIDTAILDIHGNVLFSFSQISESNSYYLILKHRNSIATWSSSPLLIDSLIKHYDFTTSINKAYGNNLRNLGDGNFAIWSGDISDVTLGVGHQDGLIESQDYSDMENAVTLVLMGYIPEDITGDGLVESADYSIIENNVYYVIASMHP